MTSVKTEVNTLFGSMIFLGVTQVGFPYGSRRIAFLARPGKQKPVVEAWIGCRKFHERNGFGSSENPMGSVSIWNPVEGTEPQTLHCCCL